MRLLLLVTLGLGCSRAPATAPAPPPGSTVDVGAVMRRVHFAWREDEGRWTAGDSTWTAQLTSSAFGVAPTSGRQAGTVRFDTPVVTRGARRLTSTWAASRTDDGALRVERGEVVEEYENGSAGVEQRWRFPAAPVGDGPLEVSVPVEARLVAATDTGLHFAAGGLLVRYGHGTWVDARGVKTPVPARFEGGAIRLTVPAEVLEASAWPAVLDPIISMQFSIDSPLAVPARADQSSPAVASNGSELLVVWADTRGGDTDIIGTRVSGAGQVADPVGLRIYVGPGNQDEPAVAWNGVEWLVVWTDRLTMGDENLGSARVTPAGRVTPGGGPIAALPNSREGQPAIACAMHDCLVVWADDAASGGRLRANLVPGNTAIGPTPVTLPMTMNPQFDPTVTFNGMSYLIAWTEGVPPTTNIMATVVPAIGSPIGSSTLGVALDTGEQARPRAASSGSVTLVVWEEAGMSSDVRGARLDGNGQLLDTSSFAIASSASAEVRPVVAGVGSGFVVAWQDGLMNPQIRARPVPILGPVSASSTILTPTSTGHTEPAIATRGTEAYLSWTDSNGEGLDVRGLRLSSTASGIGANVLLSTQQNPEVSPAIASNGSVMLVVWEDQRGGQNDSDIYGARVTPSGMVLDPLGLAISVRSGRQELPAVAASRMGPWLVAWQDSRSLATTGTDIYAARVLADGTVLDPNGLAVSSAAGDQSAPAVAGAGTNWVMVWEDHSAGDNIRANLLTASGGLAYPSAGLVITSAPGPQTAPAVAVMGSVPFVVWQDGRNGTFDPDIFGTVLQPDGGVSEVAIISRTGPQTAPAIAGSPTGAFVAWRDGRLLPEIAGAGVSPMGAVQPPVSVFTSAGEKTAPAVAFDGREWMLAWMNTAGVAPRPDVFGARVTSTGVVRDPTPFVISPLGLASSVPAVDCELRECIVVWSTVHPSADTPRVVGAKVGNNEPPTISSGTYSTNEDSPRLISPQVNDPDGDPTTLTITTPPTAGTVTGTGPLTYTPMPNFFGTDSFQVRVSDGMLQSNTAVITITVLPENDLPVPTTVPVTTVQDTSVSFMLTADDVDGDPLVYDVVTAPTVGSLQGMPPALSYTPPAGFVGTTSLIYSVTDSRSVPQQATLVITVLGVADGGAVGGGSAGGGSAGGAAVGGGSAGGVAGGPAGGGSAGGGSAGGAAVGGGSAGGVAGGPAGGGGSAGGAGGGGPSSVAFEPVGCGCQSAGGPLLLVAVALAGARRRQRAFTRFFRPSSC